MQRLFTTFADGRPGFGLLIQRVVTGGALLHNAFALPKETLATWPVVLEMSGAVLGLLIVAGLWTPVAGILVGLLEIWIALAGGSDVWMSVMLAVFGGTLAMIGPGAWSVDARLFGRKRIGS